jgi:hypothetical protein
MGPVKSVLCSDYLHHFELELKVQHSGALNGNNSVRIALPHLQALPATLKYCKDYSHRA